MENNNSISIYLILYIYFVILMIAVPFLISLVTLLAKIGMTAVVSFYVIAFISAFFLIAWMIVFYIVNLFAYLKKEYPGEGDNLLINTFCNIMVMVVLANINQYMMLLSVFPVLNLLLNLKCFLRWRVVQIKELNKI
ncbi:MAG: hypothetical protein WCX74_04300 [Candidatus Paceibacterota bacterium]